MKSNLFFFVLCFFLPLFELEKNENTWSRQAKFVEVDPTQKIIFLSAYSSRFKQLMTKIKKSVFRLFRVQACKATNHNQTSHNFLSIFLCVHGKYFIRYARSELRVFHVNLHCLHYLSWLFFFLLLNVQIFPMSMSETISYLPNMARFPLKKPNEILCGKTNYYRHS